MNHQIRRGICRITKPKDPVFQTHSQRARQLHLHAGAQASEPDLAGYNIYRSTDPNLPKDRWTKLNQALLTRTTYQDERVESGKTYYYYIQAVDKTGNVSQPSEVGSETVP